MKNNILNYILISVFTLGTLSACGTQSEEEQDNVSGDGARELSIIITKHGLTKPNKEIEWLTKLEKDLNLKIKWEEVSADWDQKKAPMLASGDIPDLILGPNAVSDSEFAKFTGLFEDLSDDLDKLPNVQKMFEEQPLTKSLATQLDGKIYGLPKYQRFWPKTASRQYINQEWLDNLGLAQPTTWDELFDVLVAFKQEDANGNGDNNDEIPMDWSPVGTGGFGYFQPMQLLASTGIVVSEGGNTGYFAENGKVGNFFVDERYKETIKFLNKCWEAGLVNTKAFSQDYSAYQSTGRGDGDYALVGYTWGWEASDRFGSKLYNQYTSLAPLKKDTSSEPTWSYETSLNYGVNFAVLASQSKNKEAALEFVNALYDPEVSLQGLFGSIGTNIEKDGETYKILPPTEENMDPGTWKWTSTWADNTPMFISDTLEVELGQDMKANVEQTEVLLPYVDAIVPEEEVVPWNMMKFSDEEATILSNNNTTIMNEAMTKFAKWVTKGGVEEEWEDYVTVLENSGLEQNIEIVQKGFENFYNK